MSMLKMVSIRSAVAIFFICLGLIPCLHAEETANTDDLFEMPFDQFMAEYVSVATKTQVSRRKAPSIVSVVTADEIREMGARDIMDVLGKIPGIKLSKYRTNGYRLFIRGFESTAKVLFMIDGRRMNEGHFGAFSRSLFQNLIVENIERVEVIRGPGSAVYGTGALLAVINVITKTADDGQQVSASLGNFGTRKYNAAVGHAGEKFRIWGHLDWFETDGPSLFIEEVNWSENVSDSGYTHPFEEKTDCGLGFQSGGFSFRGRIIDKEKAPYVDSIDNSAKDPDFFSTMMWGDLAWTGRLSDGLNMTVNLYGCRYDADFLLELMPEGFTGTGDKGRYSRQLFKIDTVGGEVAANYTLGDHLITSGAVLENSRQHDVETRSNSSDPFSDMVDVTEYANFAITADRDTWAVYLQDTWEVTDSDSVTFGVRHDHYDDFGGTTNPRIAYVHVFKNNLVARIMYGSAFRAPAFAELYEQNTILTGNPDLDPEKIHTYELGLEYPLPKNCTLNLNYFYNTIEDFIRNEETETGERMWLNIEGKARVQGVEAEVNVRFAGHNHGYVNCSYQDGEDEAGNTLPDAPRWLANAGYNHELWKYLNANASISWTGERPRAEGDSRDSLPSETLVDLTLIAKNFYKGLEIRGSVFNLFDEDYRDPNDMRVPNDLPWNDRMAWFEMRYAF